MLSSLFANESVLQAVLDDVDRISPTQHRTGEATRRVQVALLIWDPGCLPGNGADSDYGDETAAAVVRFKAEELGVPPGEIVDDVGPRTVERLDQIAAADEHGLGRELAVVGVQGVDSDTWLSIIALAEGVGGSMLMTLGPRVMLFDGGRPIADVVMENFGSVVSGIVAAGSQDIPADLDDDTVEALLAWLASVDTNGILEQLRVFVSGESFEFLHGCGQQEAAR
jgi:hypothetical protein